jgi:hypothetical protein
MGDPICQWRHLRWFVQVALTAPNAPNARSDYGPAASFVLLGFGVVALHFSLLLAVLGTAVCALLAVALGRVLVAGAGCAARLNQFGHKCNIYM